jgi:hypothetical protein
MDSLWAAQTSLYGALRARIAQLLPRLTGPRPARLMDTRRARAQLDALLCYLVERLEHGSDGASEAVAACVSAFDLREIGRAVRFDTDDDPEALSFRFHHVGLVGGEPRPGERYAAPFGMYTSDAPNGVPLQWHRFEPASLLHPLLRARPHVAFQVPELDPALAEATVILGPYEPIDGFHVAVIDGGGAPTELIETHLSYDHVQGLARSGAGALYRH